MNVQHWCRSACFNLAFFGWSFLIAVLCLPLFALGTKASRLAGRPWAVVTLWLARMILGLRHEVRGTFPNDTSPVIYACKHQSAWDTVIFLALVKHPAYVLKRELQWIPLWGWYLWRMEMIALDRAAKTGAMKRLLSQAEQAVRHRRSPVIYPEGTRLRPGQRTRYLPGVAALYHHLGIPVVPVALNSGVYWGKDAFVKKPGVIIIEFLPPIAPGLDKDMFMSRLKEAIETASQRLLEEATVLPHAAKDTP